MGGGALLSYVFRLKGAERRTIVIEVGMQNAAQAITVACSPLVFDNEVIAIPAIIYALMMNVLLLIYVAIVKAKPNTP
jgi:BASS family bile acid:Na+ symporter